MDRHSCNINGNVWKDDCKPIEDSEGNIERYANTFASEAMPDAKAALRIVAEQHDMKRLIIEVSSKDPVSGEVLVDAERVAFRHADSGYEED
jgi:hypothetical protein